MAEEIDRLSANTNESVASDDDPEVEAHARYTGNTNESVEEDDDEVEAHMRRLPPTA